MTGKTPEQLTQEIASYITSVALDTPLPGLESYPPPYPSPENLKLGKTTTCRHTSKQQS